MKRALIALLLGGSLVLADTLPIAFLESFALGDREAALDLLSPGSEEHFYHLALHQQLSGDQEGLARTLRDWMVSHPESPSAGLRRIRLRQALMDLERDPDHAWDALAEELEVQISRRPMRWAPARPSRQRLSPEHYSEEAFREEARRREAFPDTARFLPSPRTPTLEDAYVFAERAELSDQDRSAMLSVRNIQSDLPNLLRWVAEELNHFYPQVSPREGRLYALLTLDQLLELGELRPESLRSAGYVRAVVSRMAPSWVFSAEARDWVEKLPATFDDLKALARYRQLFEEVREEEVNAGTLLRFLELYAVVNQEGQFTRARVPPPSDPFEDLFGAPSPGPFATTQRSASVREEDAFSQDTPGGRWMNTVRRRLPGTSEARDKVREALLHLFRDAENTEAFSEYLEEAWLNDVFVESKLLHGTAPVAELAPLVSAARLRELLDRKSIRFPAVNPNNVSPGEPVSLWVDTVGVSDLTLRLYQINTWNLARAPANQRGRLADLLPGMVPVATRALSAEAPPGQRVRHQIDIPEIEGRGMWVVELTGGDLVARADVRVGNLHALRRYTPGGLQFTVYNESGEHLRDATVWLQGREFPADAEGRILLPFAEEAQSVTAVLRHGNFAVPDSFAHLPEQYSFEAGVLLDPHTLSPFGRPELLLRPTLRLNDFPVSPDLLEDVRVRVDYFVQEEIGAGTTVVTHTHRVALDGENWVRVPLRWMDGLYHMLVTTTANVPIKSTGEMEELVDLFPVKGYQLDLAWKRGDAKGAVLVQPSREGWWLELRGAGGTPLADEPLGISLYRPGFCHALPLPVTADEEGRVFLDDLEGLTDGIFGQVGGRVVMELLRFSRGSVSLPRKFNVLEGEALSFPFPDPAKRFVLKENRGTEVFGLITLRSLNQHVEVKDGGLRIEGLPPGRYSLWVQNAKTTVSIRVHEGKVVDEVVFDGGPVAIHTPPLIPSLVAVEDVNGETVARVRHAGPDTRLAVRYHRYQGRPFSRDDNLLLWETSGQNTRLPEVFYRSYRPRTLVFHPVSKIETELGRVQGRDPRPVFAGALLPRPSLHLNPWELREVPGGEGQEAFLEDHLQQQRIRAEARMPLYRSDHGTRSFADDIYQQQQRRLRGISMGETLFPAPREFSTGHSFYEGAVWKINLVPDAEGRVVLPDPGRPDLTAMEIHVVDPRGSSWVRHTRLDHPLQPHPETLTRGRVPDTPHAREIGIEFVAEGEERPVPTESARTLSDLSDAFEAFTRLNPDAGLDTFYFLKNWHRMDDAEKWEHLARHASHELHLFLHERDRAFFDRAVRPMLENKLHKTFVDRWLLDELTPWDRSEHALPFHGTLERVLLARRGGDRDAVLKLLRNAKESHQNELGERVNPVGLVLGTTGIPTELSMESWILKEAGYHRVHRQPEISRIVHIERRGAGHQDFDRSRSAARGIDRPRPVASERYRTPGSARLSEERGFLSVQQREDTAEPAARFRPTEEILDEIKVPELRLEQASVLAALSYLQAILLEQHQEFPDIRLQLPRLPRGTPTVTLEVREISMLDAITLITEITGLYFRIEDKQTDLFHDPIEAEREAGKSRKPRPPLGFWMDAAQGNLPSARMLDAHGDLREMLLALAWSGLPGEAAPPDAANGSPVVSGPAYVLTDTVKPAETAEAPVVIRRAEIGKLSEFSVTLRHIVANLGDEPLEVGVLWRIPPDAAFTWGAGPQTQSQILWLEPLESRSIRMTFFPTREGPLTFPPVDVSVEGKVVARTEPWEFDPAVYRVDTAAPGRTSLNLAQTLRDRDLEATFRLLARREMLTPERIGPWLDSPLLPEAWQVEQGPPHREFEGFLAARAHRVAGSPEPLNPDQRREYRQLLEILAHQAEPTPYHRLRLVYHLLVQERLAEAREHLALVPEDDPPLRWQRDYLRTWLATREADMDTAWDLATAHLDHPHPRWREKFTAIHNLVRAAREDRATEDPADHAASMELISREGGVWLDAQNLSRATLSLYPVDIETLFTRQPFSAARARVSGWVEPVHRVTLDLAEVDAPHPLPIPQARLRENLLVEVEGGGLRQTHLHLDSNLRVRIARDAGQVEVRESETGAFVPRAYVKVYAMDGRGRVVFWKEGHTDPRGRFDFLSLTDPPLEEVARLALFIHHPDHGAILRETTPPLR